MKLTYNKMLFATVLSIISSYALFNLLPIITIPLFSNPNSKFVDTIYRKWCVKHGRLHSTPSEYLYRLNNFKDSLLLSQRLNKKYGASKFGLNSLSDISNTEFQSMLLKPQIHNLKMPKMRRTAA